MRVSVNVPENVSKTRSMIESLNDTNTFIQLEKDRVAKGIEDMQMIKDNFENRCIQTCSNIKTELDRLPQLSNINLDGEQIAIISLQIPYIKEDLYKEKMSEYIDETVFMAESFKDAAERLKYIRSRLSWKRLFSVIVTDMNSIRINLYKRERIKDQSRYLRYEEAVGSTGQSQGIYIQFLIAIINYISNMNSSGNEGVEGKTIFIDNPFGAAKDIYIWEPIFKLLATNHVQLIVPARGATPAITGRFDVNYILGQKLVDSRQLFVPKIFTAIAFDSGGVASGPMTATFLLPLAQGACLAVGGNIVTDAFGVVAMVAMTPLITLQILGVIYRIKDSRRENVPQTITPVVDMFAELSDDAIIEL